MEHPNKKLLLLKKKIIKTHELLAEFSRVQEDLKKAKEENEKLQTVKGKAMVCLQDVIQNYYRLEKQFQAQKSKIKDLEVSVASETSINETLRMELEQKTLLAKIYQDNKTKLDRDEVESIVLDRKHAVQLCWWLIKDHVRWRGSYLKENRAASAFFTRHYKLLKELNLGDLRKEKLLKKELETPRYDDELESQGSVESGFVDDTEPSEEKTAVSPNLEYNRSYSHHNQVQQDTNTPVEVVVVMNSAENVIGGVAPLNSLMEQSDASVGLGHTEVLEECREVVVELPLFPTKTLTYGTLGSIFDVVEERSDLSIQPAQSSDFELSFNTPQDCSALKVDITLPEEDAEDIFDKYLFEDTELMAINYEKSVTEIDFKEALIETEIAPKNEAQIAVEDCIRELLPEKKKEALSLVNVVNILRAEQKKTQCITTSNHQTVSSNNHFAEKKEIGFINETEIIVSGALNQFLVKEEESETVNATSREVEKQIEETVEKDLFKSKVNKSCDSFVLRRQEVEKEVEVRLGVEVVCKSDDRSTRPSPEDEIPDEFIAKIMAEYKIPTLLELSLSPKQKIKKLMLKVKESSHAVFKQTTDKSEGTEELKPVDAWPACRPAASRDEKMCFIVPDLLGPIPEVKLSCAPKINHDENESNQTTAKVNAPGVWTPASYFTRKHKQEQGGTIIIEHNTGVSQTITANRKSLIKEKKELVEDSVSKVTDTKSANKKKRKQSPSKIKRRSSGLEESVSQQMDTVAEPDSAPSLVPVKNKVDKPTANSKNIQRSPPMLTRRARRESVKESVSPHEAETLAEANKPTTKSRKSLKLAGKGRRELAEESAPQNGGTAPDLAVNNENKATANWKMLGVTRKGRKELAAESVKQRGGTEPDLACNNTSVAKLKKGKQASPKSRKELRSHFESTSSCLRKCDEGSDDNKSNFTSPTRAVVSNSDCDEAVTLKMIRRSPRQRLRVANRIEDIPVKENAPTLIGEVAQSTSGQTLNRVKSLESSAMHVSVTGSFEESQAVSKAKNNYAAAVTTKEPLRDTAPSVVTRLSAQTVRPGRLDVNNPTLQGSSRKRKCLQTERNAKKKPAEGADARVGGSFLDSIMCAMSKQTVEYQSGVLKPFNGLKSIVDGFTHPETRVSSGPPPPLVSDVSAQQRRPNVHPSMFKAAISEQIAVQTSSNPVAGLKQISQNSAGPSWSANTHQPMAVETHDQVQQPPLVIYEQLQKMTTEPNLQQQGPSRHASVLKPTSVEPLVNTSMRSDSLPLPTPAVARVKGKKGKRPAGSPQLKEVTERLATFCTATMADNEQAQAQVQEVVRFVFAVPVEVVARAMVSIVLENVDEELDRSMPPPAPPLTPTQHRLMALVAVLVKLEGVFAELPEHLYEEIHDELVPERWVWPDDSVENCARFLTAVARFSHDKRPVWQLCVDAVLRMRKRSCLVIHAMVLTWTDIFVPAAFATAMPTTVAHVILKTPLPERLGQQRKQLSLKSLLRDFYKYNCEEPSEKYVEKLLPQYLLDRSNSDAVLLLSKFNGWRWTVAHVLPPVFKMLELWLVTSDAADCKVFLLLSSIAELSASFNSTDDEASQWIVNKVIQPLADLLASKKLSHQVDEAIADVLLQLQIHADLSNIFNKWCPREPISEALHSRISEALLRKAFRHRSSYKPKPKQQQIIKKTTLKKKTKKKKKKKSKK